MQTILITGATSGFGLAAAKLLAKDNKLILLGRRRDQLRELKQTLGGNVHTAVVDVSEGEQVSQFFATLPDAYKNIDGIEIMPLDQAPAGMILNKQEDL